MTRDDRFAASAPAGSKPVSQAALGLYYFAFFAAMGAYFPYMPAWLQARGFSASEISLVAALFPALSVVAPPVFGVLADALGLRGAIVRVASLGASLAMFSLAWTSSDGVVAFWSVFGLVLVFTFLRTPMQQMGDVIALEQHASRYGQLRMWGSVGFLVAAPLVGRWIALDPAWHLIAWIAGALLLVHVVSWRLPGRTSLPPPPMLSEALRLLRRPSFGWFLLTAALAQASHAAYDLCLTLHLVEMGASGSLVGVAWAIGTGAEVVLMAYSTSWLRQATLPVWLLISLAGSVVRWALMGIVSDLTLLLMLQPLHALSFGLRWLCSLLLVRRFATEATLATGQGLFLAAHALGGASGMLLWGQVYDRQGGAQVFQWAALVAAFSVVSGIFLFQRASITSQRGRPLPER